MTKRIRVQSVRALSAAALVAQVFIFQACGGGNNGMTGAAGTTGSGTAGTTATAGTTGEGGTTAAAGTTGTGGSTTTAHLPLCDGLTTVAVGNPAPTKGGACAPEDPQLCYKTCGPEKSGDKSETCTGGVYVEMSGCYFDPTHDYTCYKIPPASNTVCPTDVVPRATFDCTVDHCVLCNTTGGLPGGHYNDSGGADKIGYCTCQLPNTDGKRTWSCASDTAWPCPAGSGC